MIQGADLSSVKNKISRIETSKLPAGSVIAFAGSSAPTGYLDCDGSAVSRTTYADLFAAIGTTWGVGDGSTTFNLPDGRDGHLRGVGTSTQFTQNGTTSLADTVNDAMQGHYHELIRNGSLATLRVLSAQAGSGLAAWQNSTNQLTVEDPTTDGSNGTPRTASETRVKAIGMYFIIKT